MVAITYVAMVRGPCSYTGYASAPYLAAIIQQLAIRKRTVMYMAFVLLMPYINYKTGTFIGLGKSEARIKWLRHAAYVASCTKWRI